MKTTNLGLPAIFSCAVLALPLGSTAQTLQVKDTDDTTICTVSLGSTVEVSNDNVIVVAPDGLGECVQAGSAVSLQITSPSSVIDVEEGTTVTLAWSIPEDDNCTLTRSDQGPPVQNNTQLDNRLSPTITQTVNSNTTFTMRCVRDKFQGATNIGRDEGTSTAIVTVENSIPDPGGQCSQQLSGHTRLSSINGETTYDGLFNAFGTPSGNGNIEMGNNVFFSIPFTTPGVTDTEKLIWDELGLSPDTVTVSVSECVSAPLLVNAVDPDCFESGSGRNGGFTMESNPNGTLSGICFLERNKTYFFNVMFSDASGNPGCRPTNPSGAQCTWLIGAQ